VPDRRKHRGPYPEDDRLFAPAVWPVLHQAIADLAWMLSKGYAPRSALKLVGDRYGLVARQRTAVGRSVCSDQALKRRQQRCVDPRQISGEELQIDGYNLLTTVEAALSGGMILPGRDGTYRDMASMHGSFRRVEETRPALELIGRAIAELGVGRCVWFLDRPVSNSGRLKGIIDELAARHGWSWTVELVPNPDALLAESDRIVVTADSAILDRCRRWANLARLIVGEHVPDANVIEIV